ncbi:MAG TPA: hypothetical protein PLC19_01595, partial [Marmoricola sp.]|nr:hypothetical protein [Marmoricola sp.]
MLEQPMILSSTLQNESTKMNSFIKNLWKKIKFKTKTISSKIQEDWARGDKIDIALSEAKNQMHSK